MFVSGRSKFNSILREIESLAPKRGKNGFVLEKGNHAYEAVRKLFELIEQEYDAETAADLMKRFINAARTADFRKFKRGIDRIGRESEPDDGGQSGKDDDGEQG